MNLGPSASLSHVTVQATASANTFAMNCVGASGRLDYVTTIAPGGFGLCYSPNNGGPLTITNSFIRGGNQGLIIFNNAPSGSPSLDIRYTELAGTTAIDHQNGAFTVKIAASFLNGVATNTGNTRYACAADWGATLNALGTQCQ
jgi:hypothetical protein